MDINELHAKASEYLSDNEFEKAEELYKKVIELQPNDEAAYHALMDIYQDRDKFKYYLARANYNIVNGKLEYGINDCKKALSVDAENIEAREKLARLYRVTNKPLKAIDEFSRIIEIEPKHLQSYIELIDLYSKEGALESACDIAIKGAELFKGEFNFNDILAKIYFDLGEYDKALEVVEEVGLKIKILLQAEKNEEARKLLELVDVESKGITKDQKALYCVLWAQYCYNTKKIKSAFNFINKYMELAGPTALGFQMKALCYEEQGDEFNAAFNFGYMNKAMNKPDEALVEFNNAYVINPNNKDVLIELAKLYELNKEKYTAMDFWQKVYELDGDETARKLLADFYTQEGDNLMAQKFMNEEELKENEAIHNDLPEQEDEGFLNKIINLFSKK